MAIARWSLLCLLCLAAAALAAASTPKPILLRAGIIDTGAAPNLLRQDRKRSALPYSIPKHEIGLFLVQSRNKVDEAFKHLIAKELSRDAIIHYVPHNALLVRATLADILRLEQHEEVLPSS